MYYVYILRCTDGSLYTGITTDPERRFAQHAGTRPGGARYTAAHPPLRYELLHPCRDRREASRQEAGIKALSRREKEALIAGRRPWPDSEAPA